MHTLTWEKKKITRQTKTKNNSYKTHNNLFDVFKPGRKVQDHHLQLHWTDLQEIKHHIKWDTYNTFLINFLNQLWLRFLEPWTSELAHSSTTFEQNPSIKDITFHFRPHFRSRQSCLVLAENQRAFGQNAKSGAWSRTVVVTESPLFNYLVTTHPVARSYFHIASIGVSHTVDTVTCLKAPNLHIEHDTHKAHLTTMKETVMQHALCVCVCLCLPTSPHSTFLGGRG